MTMGDHIPAHLKKSNPYTHLWSLHHQMQELIRLITAKKEAKGLQQPQTSTLPGKVHKRHDTILPSTFEKVPGTSL